MARRIVLGLGLIASVVVVAGALAWVVLSKRTAPPSRITIQVSGVLGMKVSGTFEVDGVSQESAAEVPAEFVYDARELSFSIKRTAGPDQPVSVAVYVRGVRHGTGTASGGVRGNLSFGQAEKANLFLSAIVPTEFDAERREQLPARPRPELIGTRVPEWSISEWLNRGAPGLRLADLRGRVVLVRWFTGPV